MYGGIQKRRHALFERRQVAVERLRDDVVREWQMLPNVLCCPVTEVQVEKALVSSFNDTAHSQVSCLYATCSPGLYQYTHKHWSFSLHSISSELLITVGKTQGVCFMCLLSMKVTP